MGPKKGTLISVKLTVDPARKWSLDDSYTNLLQGTGHVSGPRTEEYICRANAWG